MDFVDNGKGLLADVVIVVGKIKDGLVVDGLIEDALEDGLRVG